MMILALDSGLERTGWAVFKIDDKDYQLVAYNCIFTDSKQPIELRIFHLAEDVTKLITKYNITHFVIEQLFFFSNKKTVIQVAQAQGAVISVAGRFNIGIDFLSPTTIKQSVAGYGNADKKAVQKMVKMILHLDTLPTPDDTVDAIACGLTYCTMSRLRKYDR